MCSFIFTNIAIEDEDKFREINYFVQRRGPDLTNYVSVNGYNFVFNLLSITGAFTPQPFIRNDILCMCNGQIYNYKKINPDAQSDGSVLIPLYEERGESFIEYLDGEFAIVLVDFKRNVLIVSSDCFATKPIWISITERDISVASYQSSLVRLGCRNIEKIEANTTCVISLDGNRITKRYRPYKFDLNQYKDSCEDWIIAFDEAIKKRAGKTREKVFVGLSSGYDSGSIAASLNAQNLSYRAYTIRGEENQTVLKERKKLVKDMHILNFSRMNYEDTRLYVNRYSEDFSLDGYSIKEDNASYGLAYICQAARREDYKIHMSGQGGDEITSDYGRFGESLLDHSELRGVFPEDLTAVFPWKNFYGDRQTFFIQKEECIGGTYGIETRYPFLDRAVVQEFLWITSSLKNKYYKAPMRALLKKRGFPFEENQKKGFSPKVRLTHRITGKLYFYYLKFRNVLPPKGSNS